ncbi:MAG TPA: hypothetical protein VND64_35345 [Pirellulales bacterium]|nr:hypothetical protein [Pirellulales bacterium]
MARFDFVKAFYKSPHQRDNIVAEIDAVLSSRPRKLQVTAIPFSTGDSPISLFVARAKQHRKILLLASWPGLDFCELRYSFKSGDTEQSGKGRFFVYHHPDYPNVYIAITLDAGIFLSKGLRPFLRGLFPHIVVGFIPHARLRRMLRGFKEENQFSELIITRAAERWRLPEEGTHRRVMSLVKWPGMALGEALDQLVEHNAWFQSLQFEAKRIDFTAVRDSFARDGECRCDYHFEQVFRGFIQPACKIHHENFNLFSRRGRRENTNLDVRPLAITFDKAQFEDVEENHRLIAAIRSMRTASVSVLHGNPYLCMSVVDYFDGSTFDIWVVDDCQLVIVPQLYGSIGAIKRLVNHIFDSYAEGEVANFAVSPNE